MDVPVVVDSLANNIERYMDMLSMRQRVVSSNIANADTPGYKTKDLDFSSVLQAAESTGQPKQIDVSGLTTKNDGNNVDLDREARLLSENALRFNIAASLMKSELTQIRQAIKEGNS